MNYFCHPLGENYNVVDPGTYYLHQYGCALDFCTTSGTPVYSMSDGVVEWAGNYGSAGPTVIIKNESNGFTSFYANDRPIWFKYLHLIDVTVEEGQQVVPGMLIGHLGWLEGSANGVSHLHLDISEVPNDDVRNFKKIIDVTGKSGDPSNLRAYMSNYDQVTQDKKGFASSAGIGDKCSYIFAIFNQEVVSVTPTAKVSEDFYSIIMNNNHGFSFDELMDMVAGLCVREIGVSLDGPSYTLSSWSLYAKLIRNRLNNNPSAGIYGILTAPNQFSGFNTTDVRYSKSKTKVNSAQLDYDEALNSILLNFYNDQTYNILSNHNTGNLSERILYNYGYGGTYSNTKDNEEAIRKGIKQGSLPSHLSFAKLSTVIGNTAFFEPK